MEILMGVLESAAYGADLRRPRSQALSAECLTAMRAWLWVRAAGGAAAGGALAPAAALAG